MSSAIMNDPDCAFYSIEEVKRKIGLSKTKAYEFARDGVFPCIIVGRQYRVPKAAFDRWLDGASDIENPGEAETIEEGGETL